MVILLPEAGRFEEFESSLDAARVAAILSELERRPVDLAMPKFSYDSSFSLRETLAAWGCPQLSAAWRTFEEAMSIDRPFIFLIRDIETGAILFVGRVLNPHRVTVKNSQSR